MIIAPPDAIKLCSAHEKELNAALNELGLAKFSAPDDAEAQQRAMHGAGASSDDPKDYEPFILAMMFLASQAFRGVGPHRVFGSKCIVCVCQENCPCARGPDCNTNKLVSIAADIAFKNAMRLGLFGKVGTA